MSSKIEDKKLIIEKFIRVKQEIGEFILCVVNPKDLMKATQKFPREYDEESDRYIGIQRKLKNDKLKEIKEYVTNDSEACFPNAIIANLDTSFLLEESIDKIVIDLSPNKEKEKGVFIIDGQHRLYSFEKIKTDFELIVVLFKGLELNSQAYLFSTVNDKQQRLNASQVQDLNEIMKIESPEKIVHRLTKVFNNNKSSTWKDKINILGGKIIRKNETVYGTMSQYSFAKEIIKLIYPSKNYFKVRNYVKKLGDRKKLKNIDELKIFSKRYPFWDYYTNKEDDIMMKILTEYFNAIRSNFKSEWEDRSKIITKTTGYIAFMRLLKDICLEKNREILKYDFYGLMEKIKEKIKENPRERDLINSNYPAGAKGQKLLYDFISDIYKKS